MAGFAESIEASAEFLNSVTQHKLSESEAESTASQFLSSTESARGFFVTLLTGSSPVADTVPDWLIKALEKNSDIVAEILVKNLVMSTATELTHKRKGDAEAAQGSALVARRTGRLIERFSAQAVKNNIKELFEAAETKLQSKQLDQNNRYNSFLTRWSYDEEQLQLMKAALLSTRLV